MDYYLRSLLRNFSVNPTPELGMEIANLLLRQEEKEHPKYLVIGILFSENFVFSRHTADISDPQTVAQYLHTVSGGYFDKILVIDADIDSNPIVIHEWDLGNQYLEDAENQVCFECGEPVIDDPYGSSGVISHLDVSINEDHSPYLDTE